MASIERSVQYRCSDDCMMSGCPGHTGILLYQSTSDAYSFNLDGRILHFGRGEMEAMFSLLRSLGRIDAVQVERPA
jgi:hypothetical protein